MSYRVGQPRKPLRTKIPSSASPVANREIALPMVAPGAVQTMSSVDLLKFVNEARAEFDEKPVRHNVFLARCKDELDGEPYKIFVEPAKGQAPAFETIEMTQDQCKLVAMRESKGVRRRVLAHLNALEAQVAQQPATSHGQPLALSQMFAMFSEQAGKIEQELRRQAKQIPHSPQLIPASARLCFYDRPNLAAQKICLEGEHVEN